MFLNEAAGKNFDLLSPDLIPNRYHLDSPFELLHLRIRAEGHPSIAVFMANTGGVYYNHSFLDEIYKETGNPFPSLLHTHEYYEFLFVIEGAIYQNIDCLRHYYPSGGCCIVAPEIPHFEEYNTDRSARLLFLKIQKEYVRSLLDISHYFSVENTAVWQRCNAFFSSSAAYLDFIPKKDYSWQEAQVHNLFERMAALLISPDTSASLEISLLIHKIMMLLFDSSFYGNTPVPTGTEEEFRLFSDIRTYMEGLPGKCTRADLEDRFHFSGDYLYKVVKNHSGLSIHDYNMRICMKKAADLLRSTDQNINDIADLLGFHNYTQFYAEFRRYHSMTPRQYRTFRA